MKNFNLKHFLLGCMTGILLLTLKHYYEKNTTIQTVEIETIDYPTVK